VPDGERSATAPHRRAISVGVFDGVHRGHRHLIAQAREQALARGLPLTVLTFDPHPRAVVNRRPVPALATLAERVDLLRACGADEVAVLHFDQQLAQTTPEEFVERVLVGTWRAGHVIVGENFRFGAGAAGTVQTLRDLGQHWDFGVTAVSLAAAPEGVWSSSVIRELLGGGNVEQAAVALLRPFRLTGTVVSGERRGRELGFPTANLDVVAGLLIPADGVYAAWLLDGPQRHPAAVSIGTNPQFAGQQRTVEAYVLDRMDLDLYGRELGLDFVGRIRGQAVFDSTDALIERMHQDVAECRVLLAQRP
jgi:riboflavin kinase/FMN adenylyltransferase